MTYTRSCRFFALLAAFVILISCDDEKAIVQDSMSLNTAYPGIGHYISAYSPQTISKADPLIIRFAKQVGDDRRSDDGFWSLKPAVSASAKWRDEFTLEVKPKDHLESGKTYALSIDLQKLFEDVPEELQTVINNYTVKKQSLSLQVNTPRLYAANGEELVTVSGSVISSDIEELAKIQTTLQFQQRGNSGLKESWDASSSRQFDFEISGIERTENQSVLKILYDGKSIDPEFKGTRDVLISPKGKFLVESIKTVNTEKKIVIRFSDLLVEDFDYTGLVQIKDYKGGFEYSADGNILSCVAKKSLPQQFQLTIDEGIKRRDGRTLQGNRQYDLSFEPTKPGLRLIGDGVIVPTSERVIFPFESANLKSVVVEVFKIYQDNVLQFLQYSELNQQYGLDAVGSLLSSHDIDLSSAASADQWYRHTLDLSKIIDLDPGAIYQVRIGFDHNDVMEYACDQVTGNMSVQTSLETGMSIMDRQPDYSYWEHRDDPCHQIYYVSSRYISRNVLSSDIGLIAKQSSSQTYTLAASNLRTLEPIAGAVVDFYDFQQQALLSTKTDASGMLTVQLDKKASFVILQHAGQVAYLSMQDNEANSLSEYNVSGVSRQDGIQAKLYGERGVWRPGDTMFLNFVLEDEDDRLPDDHPVSIEIKDSRGRLQYNRTTSDHTGGIYHFPVVTDVGAPTGNWTATVAVGQRKFRNTLKVETVKPNRLKIQYDDMKRLALSGADKISLRSQWLHGAPASGLKAKVDIVYSPINTTFESFKNYVFDDPARRIGNSQSTVFDGALNESGETSFGVKPSRNWSPPGRVMARLKTKVFEKSGNFSEDYFSLPADPYQSYVGLKMPEKKWGRHRVNRNEVSSFPLVAVDADGRALSGKKLEVGLYEANWRWWYDRYANNRYRYNSVQHNGAIKTETVTTDANGQANWQHLFKGYGAYMIRVCDPESGHCTGSLMYAGWGSSSGQEGPKLLSFDAEDRSYDIGDTYSVNIPTTANSKLFVSVEGGEEVIETFWVDGQADQTELRLRLTEEMSPNVYVHVHLIQEHNDGTNDLPLRMYGVIPVTVVDRSTMLQPSLEMADALKPNQSYSITVSEDQGQAMYYTLAVVDEGLLDLTRYRTPDLWSSFNAKQALGVKTWDLYDDVLDGYGGSLDRYISIGGGGEIASLEKSKKANRFQPVVSHLGPFYLEAGKTATHQLKMPNYIGSVKAMLVARHDTKYGKDEKIVAVKEDLMVLATVPRVLGPSEELYIPANVFAMKEDIKEVAVDIELSDRLSAVGSTTNSLTFARQGDQLSYFPVKVEDAIGYASLTINASSGQAKASDKVELDIRNPMPFTSEVEEKVIQPGESWEHSFDYFGVLGTNEGYLELSQLPSMNLNQRLSYLLRYPYGCLEQTVSKAFPQLYLGELTTLTPAQKSSQQANVIAAINKLGDYQMSSGAFSYWPGQARPQTWASSYVGHFMLAAKDRGYHVSESALSSWESAQRDIARSWSPDTRNEYAKRRSMVDQAYRLYTLSIAGAADLGAMNRLQLMQELPEFARALLAAAYAKMGKGQIASQLIEASPIKYDEYKENYYTFGSRLRDQSMVLLTLMDLGKSSDAAALARDIAEDIGSSRWHSTHTSSWALLSLGQFASQFGKSDMRFDISVHGDAPEQPQINKTVYQRELDPGESNEFSVKNTSESVLFARLVKSGQRAPSADVPADQNHMSIKVEYLDESGQIINPSRLAQGTDFLAKVTLSNKGSRRYDVSNLALKQIFPSGWEIQNERLSGDQSLDNSECDHREIRDDRVYTFMNLRKSSPKTFYVRLTATYPGKFFLPPVRAEAMYDHEIYAQTQGQWVEVFNTEIN